MSPKKIVIASPGSFGKIRGLDTGSDACRKRTGTSADLRIASKGYRRCKATQHSCIKMLRTSVVAQSSSNVCCVLYTAAVPSSRGQTYIDNHIFTRT